MGSSSGIDGSSIRLLFLSFIENKQDVAKATAPRCVGMQENPLEYEDNNRLERNKCCGGMVSKLSGGTLDDDAFAVSRSTSSSYVRVLFIIVDGKKTRKTLR
jgi:hypothetical protein